MDKYYKLDESGKKIMEKAIAKQMKPLEERDIAKPREHKGRTVWGTCANPLKLETAIRMAMQIKGDPDTVLINGERIVLSLAPFLLWLNDFDDGTHERLDTYLEELKSQIK